MFVSNQIARTFKFHWDVTCSNRTFERWLIEIMTALSSFWDYTRFFCLIRYVFEYKTIKPAQHIQLGSLQAHFDLRLRSFLSILLSHYGVLLGVNWADHLGTTRYFFASIINTVLNVWWRKERCRVLEWGVLSQMMLARWVIGFLHSGTRGAKRAEPLSAGTCCLQAGLRQTGECGGVGTPATR